MANYNIAYPLTANFEGGFANVPGDKGKETYAGITRINFPKWEGWKIVDANKPLKHNQRIKDQRIESLIHEFYKVNFWDKIRGDEIINQISANQIYDMSVNAGISRGIKLAQVALNIEPTGVMDDFTLSKINNKA